MNSSRFVIATVVASFLMAHPSHAGFLFFKTPAELSVENSEKLQELKVLRKKEKDSLKKKGQKLTIDEQKRLSVLEKQEKRLKEKEARFKEKTQKLVQKREEADKFKTQKSSVTFLDLFAVKKQAVYEPLEAPLTEEKKSVLLLDDSVKTGALSVEKVTRKGKKWAIDEKFEPQTVSYSGEKPGTIVIDSKNKFLYFVDSPLSARRYGVAIGKDGLAFEGTVVVDRKAEWPRWIPTAEMIERDPKKYKKYEDGMDGGPENPLGARAIYLSDPKTGKDTYLRIHGTTQPWTIGTASSNGCFRMVNEHVMELFEKVPVGTIVKVI